MPQSIYIILFALVSSLCFTFIDMTYIIRLQCDHGRQGPRARKPHETRNRYALHCTYYEKVLFSLFSFNVLCCAALCCDIMDRDGMGYDMTGWDGRCYTEIFSCSTLVPPFFMLPSIIPLPSFTFYCLLCLLRPVFSSLFSLFLLFFLPYFYHVAEKLSHS